MQITLSRDEVLALSAAYTYRAGDGDDGALARRMEVAAERGFMFRDDLVAVAKWKWQGPRTSQLAGQNTEHEVQEISRAAFSAGSERLRIGALLALQGVSWPMASVVLHFAFPTRYPILDVRAMETVGGSTLYNFERWLRYVDLCRETAGRLDVTMRELDRALWNADKKRTPRRTRRKSSDLSVTPTE